MGPGRRVLGGDIPLLWSRAPHTEAFGAVCKNLLHGAKSLAFRLAVWWAKRVALLWAAYAGDGLLLQLGE